MLHVTARQLRHHLSRGGGGGGGGGGGCEWEEEEASDHRNVVPGVLRFVHSLLRDYHASFVASEVEVPLSVLREVCGAYFSVSFSVFISRYVSISVSR